MEMHAVSGFHGFVEVTLRIETMRDAAAGDADLTA
jgi:hypothetical protein